MTPLNTTPPRPIDSSSLSKWSNQEIFDYTISLWAERDFALALNEGGSCRYRGAAAGPCLIGMVMPDSSYNPFFEGVPFSRIWEKLDPNMRSDRIDFLADLQAIHDSTPRDKRSRVWYLNTSIRQFALQNRLTLPQGVGERLEALGKSCPPPEAHAYIERSIK